MNLSNFWTSSIAQQEDSSGGQLKKNSITLWGPGTFEYYGEDINAVQFYGSIEPKTTYGVTITVGGHGEHALERFLGCILIGVMPDEGLEEALFSLHDMFEFYQREREPHRAALEPKTVDGTLGNKKKRPDLILT